MSVTICVDYDKVTVCGQVIKRPDYVSRGEWYSFWEAARLLDESPARSAFLARYWRYAS